MGASFRNIGEITELAGCDLLTIAPKLLAELEACRARCPASSTPPSSRGRGEGAPRPGRLRGRHAADQMATDKLKEGIDGFRKAITELEKSLEARLAGL